MSGKAEATRELILRSARRLIYERGYAGTSLDEVVAATGLTKGAFVYHFRSKADLGEALASQFAIENERFFLDLARRAEERSEEPLQSVLAFLELFEDYLANRPRQLRHCLFAAYAHELEQFGPRTVGLIRSGIAQWKAIYRERFERVLAVHTPRHPVTADDLADMIMSLIEGGVILGRIEDDPRLIARQSAQFRTYLRLLFAA